LGDTGALYNPAANLPISCRFLQCNNRVRIDAREFDDLSPSPIRVRVRTCFRSDVHRLSWSRLPLAMRTRLSQRCTFSSNSPSLWFYTTLIVNRCPQRRP
jgi:hypothetical protein